MGQFNSSTTAMGQFNFSRTAMGQFNFSTAAMGLFQKLEAGSASCHKHGYLPVTTTDDRFEHVPAAMDLNLSNMQTLKIHHMGFLG